MDFVLGQVVKEGAGAAISEKVARAGEMMGFIARLPSDIERNHYLKKTAEALDVAESDLRQELSKAAKKTVNVRGKEHVVPSARQQRPKAEEILIHLMLKDEKTARLLKEQLSPQDFTDPLFQLAAAKIFEVLDSRGELDISALLAGGDEELSRLISRYSVLESNYEDPEKHCRDCIDVIKQRDPEKRIKLLVKEIREADERGDAAALARLYEEQNALTRRPGRKIPGM